MIALLHLSDIHIRDDDNTVTRRTSALAATVRSETAPLKACFIALTGDIAFSGRDSEYAIAQEFLTLLKDKIAADHTEATVEYLVVPGNHDCNFERSTDLRDLALDNIPKSEALDLSGAIVNNCLSVQKEYLDFAQRLTGSVGSDTGRLYEERVYEIDAHRIAFHLYNTAWLSRLRETPGTLAFPVVVASAAHSTSNTADVAVV